MKTRIIGIWTILILAIGFTRQAGAQVRAEVWFPAPPPPPGVIITNVPPPPHRVIYREYREVPRYHRHYHRSYDRHPGYRYHRSERWHGHSRGDRYYKHPGHRHGHKHGHKHRR